MPQKFSLENEYVIVGSARINERGEFVKLYINDGEIYKVSVALLKKLLDDNKRFVEILGKNPSVSGSKITSC